MTNVIFYHAGYEVCISAEHMLAEALDPTKYELEIVHFGDAKDRIPEAEAAGVQSVPALVMNEQPSNYMAVAKYVICIFGR